MGSLSRVNAALLVLAAAPLMAQVEAGANIGRITMIRFKELGVSSRVALRGTLRATQAEGVAKVRSHEGNTSFRASFRNLPPAERFGSEYLTYVVWAVAPGPRVENLGELVVENGKGRLDVSSNLQAFGILVTAEPNYAVAGPSDLVVLRSVPPAADLAGALEVSFPLQTKGPLDRDDPAALAKPDPRISPYVRMARLALKLAEREQVERSAPEAYRRAVEVGTQLEAERKLWKGPAVALARQTVERVEEARQLATRNREQARLREAQVAAAEAQRAAEEAERVAKEAERNRESLNADSERARQKAAQQAALEASIGVRSQIRQQLTAKLNALLQTQDTERGLVVRMSDLLFPSGRAELAPAAREKLAKVAGLLLAHPGLQVTVEGHADTTGRPEFNQRLSELRAAKVRDFLVGAGLPPQAVVANGLGSSRPISQDTSGAGRQRNRRVELILSGEPIDL